MTLESAVMVLIPEADNLLENFRKHRDPSAAVGVPAHVTILYPFKAPAELTAETVSTLRELFASVPPFASVLQRQSVFWMSSILHQYQTSLSAT